MVQLALGTAQEKPPTAETVEKRGTYRSSRLWQNLGDAPYVATL